MKVTSRESKDRIKELQDYLKSFQKDAVVVGIPEDKSSRKEGEITNAAIAFINEFGSPANNIPPRPAFQIGIAISQAAIIEETAKMLFASFADVALGKPEAARARLKKYYERIGLLTANNIKAVITQQTYLQAPAAATIASRKSKGYSSLKSLLVTGQYRNSITYVVRDSG